MNGYSVLVVDDEPLARMRIQSLLDESGFENVEEAAHGEAALKAIQKNRPDLLFLDVQMPELSGFDVLHKLDPDQLPVIIFVTAHDKYALRAFDAHAFDYLLKPFDDERFESALHRAIELLELKRSGKAQSEIRELLAAVQPPKSYQSHFIVKLNDRAIVVDASTINWIEASANYIKLHVSERSYLLRETMASMEEKLDPEHFIRIHRSTIVKIDSISELQPWSHGDYAVILKDGQRLKMSRHYRHHVKSRIGGTF